MANEDEYYDSRMLLKQLIFNEEKKVWEIWKIIFLRSLCFYNFRGKSNE